MRDTPPEDPRRKMPGFGVGLYVMVLAVIFAGGVTGMSLSMWVLWQSGANLSPMNLSYGGVVDSRILAPMRVAGLLGDDEIPDAFHAERIDGSVACIISSGELRRLGPDGEQERLRLQSLTSVTRAENEVTAVGPEGRIVCFFNPGEGADRFERMLQSPGAEALRE